MWAGIKGTSIVDTLQALIQGKDPRSVAQTSPITMPEGGTAPSGMGSGLAAIMLQHLDHPYSFGGAPGPDGTGPWDCSSAVNWCATQDGLPIPGAKHWSMNGHGPSTLVWLAWAPANLKHVPAGQVQADDLVIWQTHMGVATSPTEYVSAASHGAQAGGHTDTIVLPIHGGGPKGEVASFWRYPGGSGTGTAQFGGGSFPFTHAQLMKLWVQAGGPQSTANNAACHAMQESSGHPDVLNVGGPGPGCTAVGLWQLATPCGVGKGYTVEQLKDPLLNARLTVRATKGGRNWSHWQTPGC